MMATSSKPQEEEDWDEDLSLTPPAPKWRHFIVQLNHDPGDGSTAHSGLGNITMKEKELEMKSKVEMGRLP